MELSRQRLRPALNEGSHITCPRCNGTGVIRDAESSALQVLRLLQEEAMKENTAAVHAQVPVDVATFLLNEKRSDITKIEARLKVNLILIPNRHLETPHHHIERLRHDDPRLEDIKTSFDMVDAPSTDMSWAPKEQEVKAKPEALVKGITPSQPAPVSSTPAKKAASATTESSPGLFKRLMGWLTGGSSEEKKVEEAPKPSDARGDRGRHSQGNRGNGNRGGQNRGRRPEHRNDARPGTGEGLAESSDTNRRPGRDDERPGTSRAPGAEQGEEPRSGGRNPRGRGRHRRDEGDTRQDATEGAQSATPVTPAANAQGTGSSQAPRASQGPRPDTAFVPHENEHGQPQSAGPEGQQGPEDDNDRNDPDRKRRRRRSRRGKRQDEGSGAENADGSTSTQNFEAPEQAESFVPAQVAQPPAQAPVAYAAPAAPAPYVTISATTPSITPAASAEGSVAAPVVAVDAAVAPVVVAVVAPVAEAFEPVAVAPETEAVALAAIAPVAVAPVVVAPVVVAPVVVAPVVVAPVVVAPVAVAPVADLATLHAIVRSAGLQWVESDPARVAETLAQQPSVTVKLGRERKPTVTLSSDPLVQVETRG